MKQSKIKYFLLCLFLTILIVGLFEPFYFSSNTFKSIWRTSFNTEARIDIENRGTSSNNTIQILSPIKYEKPNWCKNDKGSCVVINEVVTTKWHTYKIKFQVIKDGKISIILRGPDKRDKNNLKYPIIVNYNNLIMNNSHIFDNEIKIWHDKPYKYIFSAQNGDIIEFQITTKKHVFQLSDLKDIYHFNTMIFLSIFILSFLFSYKLLQYISKFKILEKNSITDIVFLFFLIILLFIPITHISNVNKLKQENRLPAPFPNFFIKNQINQLYGKEFENWFNDRLFGRMFLINLNDMIKYKINNIYQNDKAIKLKDNMIFNKDILNILSQPIPLEKLEKIVRNIQKLQEFTTKHNIKLYVMIPPAKEDVFFDKIPFYKNNTSQKKSIIDGLVDYVHKNKNIKIIYPRELYLKEYNDFLFFKTDHHWTEFGAFLGYQKLLINIKKDYPKISILKEKDFNIFYHNLPRLGSFKNLFERHFYKGSDCQRIGLFHLCPLNDQYKYYNYKEKENLHIENGPIKMSRKTHYKNGIDKNVTLLGNSYGGFLMEFLPYNFKNVQMLRVNNEEPGIKNVYEMKRFEKYILDFKTDILIFYLPSSDIYEFMNLYTKD